MNEPYDSLQPLAPIHSQHPPPRRSNHLVWWMLGAMTVLFLVIFLACSGLFVFEVASATANGKTMMSRTGISKIQTTASFREDFSLNSDADLAIKCRYPEQYLLVLSEADDELGPISLADFSQRHRNNLQSTLSKFDEQALPSNSVGGMPAIQHRINGSLEGTPLTYWLTTIDGRQHKHAILGWMLASDAERKEDQMLEMVDSFRETSSSDSPGDQPALPLPMAGQALRAGEQNPEKTETPVTPNP